MRLGLVHLALLAGLLAACEDCSDRPAARGGPSGRTTLDGGAGEDLGGADAGRALDATDLGVALDAGGADAGFALDATDLGSALDAGADAGFVLDATDVGFAFDATPVDAGFVLDATDVGFAFDAAPDLGFADASTPDLGSPDTGVHPGFGDIWIELDYTRASSPRSPRMTFSNTPGWGEAQWAASNARWPEAWDRFNNMQIVNDPIGTSLEIGSSSQLQLMIGLEELISYSSAEVVLVGRSRATSSSVRFEVTNPWTGCGAAGMMSNDWSPDTVVLDLAQCYVTGSSGGVQAVRVDPTSGTVALQRLRLTLYGARW